MVCQQAERKELLKVSADLVALWMELAHGRESNVSFPKQYMNGSTLETWNGGNAKIRQSKLKTGCSTITPSRALSIRLVTHSEEWKPRTCAGLIQPPTFELESLLLDCFHIWTRFPMLNSTFLPQHDAQVCSVSKLSFDMETSSRLSVQFAEPCLSTLELLKSIWWVDTPQSLAEKEGRKSSLELAVDIRPLTSICWKLKQSNSTLLWSEACSLVLFPDCMVALVGMFQHRRQCLLFNGSNTQIKIFQHKG